MSDSVAIGIDLGTTYSCVAVFQNGQTKVIPNQHGTNITPSYVAFENGEVLVGQDAKSAAFDNPKNTVFAIKRIIGRRFNEREINMSSSRWPFQIINHNGVPRVKLTDKGSRQMVAPEEVSAELLKYLKGTAEKYLGKSVTKAVITVPANFADSQRRATKLAAEKAGLQVLDLINEPTAAAVAYGLQNRASGDQKKTILVFDFGGGTLDVSIIVAEKKNSFKVLATEGDMYFGGEDFDEVILQKLIYEFECKHGPGLKDSQSAVSLLRGQAEQAKRTLSGATKANITVPCLYDNKDFQSSLTREDFEKMCKDLFPKILIPVAAALTAAKMNKNSIHQVVLIGGSSRIPKVEAILQEYFTSQQIFRDISPDEAVAMGASVLAHTLVNQSADILLADIIPHSLGIEVRDKSLSVLIPKNTLIPIKVQKSFVTADDYQSVCDFPVYEGENLVASQNRLWGSLQLRNIRSAKKGEVSFPVTFEYDRFGLLKIHVEEIGANNTADLTIKLN